MNANRWRAAAFAILCAPGLFAAAPDQPDLKEILSWLPADTETVIGANGPFALKDLDAANSTKPLDVPSPDELKMQMQALALGLFSLDNGGLQTFLGGAKMALALEGSRRYRPPKELGGTLFEGCAIAVLADAAAIDSDAFMHKAASSAKRVENIEGLTVAVFEENMEKDLVTTYLAFPRKNVVLVATNQDYLHTVLSRMHATAPPRALPETLAEVCEYRRVGVGRSPLRKKGFGGGSDLSISR